MKIEYVPTRDDLKDAYLAHRSRHPVYRILDIVFFKLAPSVAVVSLIVFFVAVRDGIMNSWIPWLAQLPAVMIALTGAALIERLSAPRRFRMSMFPASVTDRTIAVEVSDDKLVSSIPGVTRFEYSWGSISLFLCSARVNLLYISPGRFVLIPNRALTKEEKASLNETITRKGIKRKS
jgi:hypothetical protein